jgi:hypothetical protein
MHALEWEFIIGKEIFVLSGLFAINFLQIPKKLNLEANILFSTYG